MHLELNTVKPGSKKAYLINSSLMLRDRQGNGDEQIGKNFAVGTLREAKKITAELKRSFDKPWIEPRGSVTVGYHNDISVHRVVANEYGEPLIPDDYRTWGPLEEIVMWSNENRIPW